MPNQPKLHHFLPEAYLRRFANERGDLWVLDLKRGIVRRQSPEVTGAERELYTLENDCGERDRRVESALAGLVDGPGQHAIQVLDEGGRLTDEELLAMFNAMREERRPYHNDFVKMMVNLVPMLPDAIHGLEWFIASAPPGKAFVTCDAPVIITRAPNHSPLMGVGLTTPGSEKIIPLSSRVALLMGDQVARPTVAHITIDRDHLRRVNEALVRRCERFAMGRNRAPTRSSRLSSDARERESRPPSARGRVLAREAGRHAEPQLRRAVRRPGLPRGRRGRQDRRLGAARPRGAGRVHLPAGLRARVRAPFRRRERRRHPAAPGLDDA